MPRDRVLPLLDQLVEIGIQRIHWLGGDPLLHPDFFEITEYAGEKGMKCAFFTSGINLNKKIAKWLVQTANLQAMAINIEAWAFSR